MLRSMSARELQEWRVIHAKYEWFGDERADLRNGILCSLIDQVNRTKGRPKPPKHYMPFQRKTRVTDPKQMFEMFKMMGKPE